MIRQVFLMAVLLLVLLGAGLTNCFGQFDPNIFYRIVAKHSGKCLDVSGGPNALANGVQVIQWDCNGGDNQKWQIVAVGDGYSKILAKHSGKALDVFGGTVSTGNGVIVHQWDYNGTANQQWRVVRNGAGDYILTARHSGKVLDINGGPSATANGVQAQQWEDVGGANQRWTITPLSETGTAGVDTVTGGFSYKDTEADPDGGNSITFNRPIVHCRVQVWRAGALAVTTETDDRGIFNATVPHMPSGTDTTVLIYATNAAAQVLAAAGPYFLKRSKPSQGSAVLDFSETFETPEQVRSFNAAHDLRLAYDFARARRDPNETEVIPIVDVSFNDLGGLMTHYNPLGSGLTITLEHNMIDLTIMHEYAHFLEDKIGSFLVLPSHHDGCFTSQRCLDPAQCNTLPDLPAQTQLVNSPENAWMEGFADYFAMAVKRANPSERFNLTWNGTATEDQLNNVDSCNAVGRPAFDGRVINGEMVEFFVAGVLWDASNGGSEDAAVFKIFDHELDFSTTHALPNIKLFHDAWVARGFDHPRLDDILRRRGISTVANH